MEPYKELEVEFAKLYGMDPDNVVACSSGTAALHLGMEAMMLPLYSRVIIPDYTMVACARAVTLAGHFPVFMDCLDNLLISPEETNTFLYNRLHDRSRVDPFPNVIMAVHVYGRYCDMDAFDKIRHEYKMILIEDLAECHGIRPHHSTDVACWSFYKNKIVHGEEGGMVYFRNKFFAKRARSLRSLGFTEQHDFLHHPRGHNYRLANCLAELILPSLLLLPENLARRREIEKVYNVYCPDTWRMPHRDVVWVYDLKLPKATIEEKNAVVAKLNSEGIQARNGFVPMTLQPEYYKKDHKSSVAHKCHREILYLPVQPGVTTEDDIIRAFSIMHTMRQELGF